MTQLVTLSKTWTKLLHLGLSWTIVHDGTASKLGMQTIRLSLPTWKILGFSGGSGSWHHG